MYALIRMCIVEKNLWINKRVYTFIRNGRVEATILLLICGLIFFSYFLRPDFTRKSRTSNWLCTRLSQALSRSDFWKKGTQSDLIIFHYTLHPYVLLHAVATTFVFDTIIPCGFWFNTNYFRQTSMRATVNSCYFCCFTEK